MGFLSKDAIATAQDALTRVLEVPEWGGSVKIKTPSALDLETFTKAQLAGNYMQAQIELCAAAIVDEQGNRLFVTDEDKLLLGKKAMDVLKRVHDAINDLADQREPLDEKIKNSPATTTESTSLGSVEN